MSDITVIGAAITGPSAALRLASLGHNVTVYEQRPSDGLYSAGILGITRGNWNMLVSAGVRMWEGQLRNKFRDYGLMRHGEETYSPFKYIAWTDLHRLLTQAAIRAGAEFRFGIRANPDTMQAEYMIDATGIFSASKRLRSSYSGFAIYRGTSQVQSKDDFVVYRELPFPGYYTQGITPYGAAWAYFLPRQEPRSHATVSVASPPVETAYLPREFQRVIQASPDMIVSYMSDWDVPHKLHDPSYRRFTLGDANGPVRPVTTSGANLAVMEGMTADILVSGSHTAVREYQRAVLDRRRYDIALGQSLEGVEIGGQAEDAQFNMHHNALFLDGQR